jgi:nicotinamide-nucleotide amidase
MTMKTLTILSVGDELLDGRVQDRNSFYLAGIAAQEGMQVARVLVIADDEAAIVAALRQADTDLVVVSGGLGPTDDDVTRDAAATLVGAELRLDEDLLGALEEAFLHRGYPFTANNRRQCAFPESAVILPTEVGTAAGFSLRHDGKDLYFFPGVPGEFRWYVDRYLAGTLPRAGEPLLFPTRLLFFGLGESDLETRIADATAEARRSGVRVGFRADRSLIEVSLKGASEHRAAAESRIRQAIGPWLVAEGEQSFSERLAHALLARGQTVSVAESCTGGLVGARLTEVPGSSAYFERGFLTYSNQAKVDLVGVDPTALARFGAVSPQVVAQMALGAASRARAAFGIAVSGIAGPTGGTADKPVGTVEFGLATPEGVFTASRVFPRRTRRHVRTLSVHTALALLLWYLEGRLGPHETFGPFSAADVIACIDTKTPKKEP